METTIKKIISDPIVKTEPKPSTTSESNQKSKHACDRCRRKRIKCSNVDGYTGTPCSFCCKINDPCTYYGKHGKRGPKPKILSPGGLLKNPKLNKKRNSNLSTLYTSNPKFTSHENQSYGRSYLPLLPSHTLPEINPVSFFCNSPGALSDLSTPGLPSTSSSTPSTQHFPYLPFDKTNMGSPDSSSLSLPDIQPLLDISAISESEYNELVNKAVSAHLRNFSDLSHIQPIIDTFNMGFDPCEIILNPHLVEKLKCGLEEFYTALKSKKSDVKVPLSLLYLVSVVTTSACLLPNYNPIADPFIEHYSNSVDILFLLKDTDMFSQAALSLMNNIAFFVNSYDFSFISCAQD